MQQPWNNMAWDLSAVAPNLQAGQYPPTANGYYQPQLNTRYQISGYNFVLFTNHHRHVPHCPEVEGFLYGGMYADWYAQPYSLLTFDFFKMEIRNM